MPEVTKPQAPKPLTRDERVVRAVLLVGDSYWLAQNLIVESPEVADRVAACVDAAGEPIDLDCVRKLLRDGLESQKGTSEGTDKAGSDQRSAVSDSEPSSGPEAEQEVDG